MKECSCSATAIARYQKRISGPLLDRIDIHVEVPRVDYEKLADKRNVENSQTVRSRVQAARERQLQRFAGTRLTCNAEMGPSKVRSFCGTDASGERLLQAYIINCRLLDNTWAVSCRGTLLITVPFRLMKMVTGKDVMPYLIATDPSASSTVG